MPFDGSDHSKKAIEKAIYLAKKLGVSLHCLFIIDMNVFDKTIPPNQDSNHLKAILETEGRKNLDYVKKRGKEYGINIQTQLFHGIPNEEIINNANKDDLIVMGSKGKSTFQKLLIGSVSEQVLHHADGPVMIVK